MSEWRNERYIPIDDYYVVRVRYQSGGVIGVQLFQNEGSEIILHQDNLKEIAKALVEEQKDGLVLHSRS